MDLSILFVRAKNEPACFSSVKQALSQTPGIELLETGNTAEATMVLQNEWKGLIVLTLSTQTELMAIIKFLSGQINAIKKKKVVRVIVFNQLPNAKARGILNSLGCSEVLDYRTTGKAFIHKLQRHLKLLQTTIQNPPKDAPDDRFVDEEDETDQAAAKPKLPYQLIAPLAHLADYWLTRNKPDAKRIMGRWLVEMIGPGPSIGEWITIPLESKERGVSGFEWKVRDPEGSFATPQGRWVFVGRSVDFDWRANRWRFVGEKVSLTFQEDGKIVAMKFVGERTGVLQLASNSAIARARLPKIEESFNIKARFSEEDTEGSELAQTQSRKKSANHSDDEDLVVQLDDEPSLSPSSNGKKKRKGGFNVAIENDDEGEAPGPEIRLSRKRAQDEASEIALDDDPDGGPAIRPGKNKPGEAKGGIDFSSGSEVTGWNDSSGSGETESPPFNDHGARRQNVFNSGRGITQGKNSDRVTYEDEEYSTGVDAFKPVRLQTTVQNTPAEILQSLEGRLRIRVEQGPIEPGSEIHLKSSTVNLEPPGDLSAMCRVLLAEPEQETQAICIEVELKPDAASTWEQLQAAVTERQMQILRFLKLAKGI